MTLYQKSLQKLEEILSGCKGMELQVKDAQWENYEEPRLLLKSETAYELGGGEKEAVSGVFFQTVSSEEEQKKDRIILYGPDLSEIHEDCNYARFTVITLREEDLQSGENGYRLLRKIEYTRYHTHPKGFMMRISSGQGREPVRIGRQELQQGMNFEKIGNVMLKQYHKYKEVAAVTVIFVTDSMFSYEKAKNLSQEAEKITSSMEEVFQKLSMDCGTCSLKEICDSVEGMKELHFGLQSS